MRRLTVLKFLFLVAVVACLCVPAAHASAALRLFDGATCATSNCVTIADTGAVGIVGTGGASGIVTSPGFVVATVSVGSVFTVNVQTGESKPLLPGGNAMDLTTNNVIASGAGTLHIWWSDINFKASPGGVFMSAGGTIAGGIGTLTYNSYTDAGNALFAPTTLAGTLGPFSTASFSGNLSGGAVPPANYALMEELVLTVPGATHVSGDFSLEVVPEPASVALLGGVLLLTVSLIRRRATRV